MLIKNAKVFRESGAFEDGDIAISGELFADAPGTGGVFDAAGCYAVPGFIDIHFHGCVGHDFSDAGAQGLGEMARFQATRGTTAICPATLTLPEEHLAAACRRIAALDDPEGAAVVGIHLEGPFLSYNKRGAQNPDYLRLPDEGMIRKLQREAGGLIKLISIAPELEGAIGFIKSMSGEIRCSVAHTEASYGIALEAFQSGARQATHLYNGMPPFHHREPCVIGAAMDSPECSAELICDGVHVHPSVVRATFRMFGDGRVILISDSMMATGMADGAWVLGGLEVEVRGRAAYLAVGGSLAGSVTTLSGCVRVAVAEMGIPLESAVKCASANPAKAIGVYDERGSIEPGKIADLVLLNEDLSVRDVFLRGKPLAKKSSFAAEK